LEARAGVTISRSFQFPELNASGSATYSNIQGNIQSPQFRESFAPQAGLDISWEVDFWGRFRRGTEAARADLLASEAARQFVLISLVSDAAGVYFNIRNLDTHLTY